MILLVSFVSPAVPKLKWYDFSYPCFEFCIVFAPAVTPVKVFAFTPFGCWILNVSGWIPVVAVELFNPILVLVWVVVAFPLEGIEVGCFSPFSQPLSHVLENFEVDKNYDSQGYEEGSHRWVNNVPPFLSENTGCVISPFIWPIIPTNEWRKAYDAGDCPDNQYGPKYKFNCSSPCMFNWVQQCVIPIEEFAWFSFLM